MLPIDYKLFARIIGVFSAPMSLLLAFYTFFESYNPAVGLGTGFWSTMLSSLYFSLFIVMTLFLLFARRLGFILFLTAMTIFGAPGMLLFLLTVGFPDLFSSAISIICVINLVLYMLSMLWFRKLYNSLAGSIAKPLFYSMLITILLHGAYWLAIS